MYQLRVNNIDFSEDLSISPARLTVFIGPNNAGKTQVLRDIASELTGSSKKPVVLSKLTYARPETFDDLVGSPYPHMFEATDQGSQWQDLSLDLCSNQNVHTILRWPEGFFCLWEDATAWDAKLKQAGLEDRQVSDWFGHLFGSRLVAFLNTSKRLELLSKGNLSGQRPQSLLEALYNSDQATEDRVHATFRSVFARDFVLDYSRLNSLGLVVGEGPDELPAHPRKLREALQGHIPLNDQGDGMRAFLGLLVALECVDRPVFLVDEPETFLHPPQARRIGELLAQIKAEKNRQVFVATHSVDVLRGVLSGGLEGVQIIRLNRYEDRTTVAAMNPAELARIANDPVLSSARVLDGLFYSSSVVVEGDRDARFFQAVADRLRSHIAPYFLVSQGKQTAPKLVAEYRRLGIPTAAVADFDALREESLLVEFLRALGLVQTEIAKVQSARTRIEAKALSGPSIAHRIAELQKGLTALEAQLDPSAPAPEQLAQARRTLRRLQQTADAWGDAKRLGRKHFDQDGKQDVESVLASCRDNGLFLCPDGELESFFRETIDETDKSKWLVSALKNVAKYEVVESEDPWQFVRSILLFLEAQLRIDKRESKIPENSAS